MTVTIAIDAMGGDNAPDVVVRGAAISVAERPDIKILFFGDEEKLSPLIERESALKGRSELIHTSEVITADMKPSAALRGSKSSSMRLAIEAVKDGRADAVVSAGNTGAYMALSKILLRMLDGIDRPAIASVLPSLSGEVVMLDLGANVECSPENLVQFALMGEVFARFVLNKENPSVGLLNVGVEKLKGNPTIREAHEFLKSNNVVPNLYGFVEGDDIAKGTVDVLVTDGFTGNVALKSIEGTVRLVTGHLRKALKKSWLTRLVSPLFLPILQSLRQRLDPRRYNGAIFLGLNGISVKSHGSTDAFGFSHAVGVAVDIVNNQVNDRICAELKGSDRLAAANRSGASG